MPFDIRRLIKKIFPATYRLISISYFQYDPNEISVIPTKDLLRSRTKEEGVQNNLVTKTSKKPLSQE